MTDPPYGVDYEGKAGKIANDNLCSAEFAKLLTDAFAVAGAHLKEGGSYYVWCASKYQSAVEAALKAAGLYVKQQLIWVKNAFVLGRQDYQWQHEPCFYGWKAGGAHYFVNDRTQSTVQEPTPPVNMRSLKKADLQQYCQELLDKLDAAPTTVVREDKPSVSELHPTMKPVRLIGRLIANSTKKGDVVFDGFGGSGSTLIACEQLGRACRIVELDERYASVIVDRWEKYTGQTAQRIDG